MFIEPTITQVPSGFSGYIWLGMKLYKNDKFSQLTCRASSKCLNITSFQRTFNNYITLGHDQTVLVVINLSRVRSRVLYARIFDPQLVLQFGITNE